MPVNRMSDGLYVKPRVVRPLDECLYYHTIELPEFGLVRGSWDLRGREDSYLGDVDFEGRSVLEIGPASGFLTAHLESRGASVTAVELGAGDPWDVVPQRTLDLSDTLRERPAVMERLRNSFWMTHQQFGLSARVHEGRAQELPAELGHFDVGLIAA